MQKLLSLDIVILNEEKFNLNRKSSKQHEFLFQTLITYLTLEITLGIQIYFIILYMVWSAFTGGCSISKDTHLTIRFFYSHHNVRYHIPFHFKPKFQALSQSEMAACQKHFQQRPTQVLDFMSNI